MKKTFVIVISLIVIFGIAFGINKTIVNEISNDESSENIEEKNEEKQDTVKIIDGKIQNENLIDEFIEKTSSGKENAILRIQDIIIDDSSDFIEIEYFSSKLNEKNEIEYGYYLLKINDEEKELSGVNYFLKRKTEDGKVYLYFDSIGIDRGDVFSPICNYDLDSSNYKKDFELSFHQRKDMGAKKIIGPESSVIPIGYSVYTVGGDVDITIENDMVYDFEKALKEKVLTVEQILEQAKIDDKYGVCKEGMYRDGGTLEYLYDDYTIIKYNTLDGNEDFVIGPKGNIRNQADEILYK